MDLTLDKFQSLVSCFVLKQFPVREYESSNRRRLKYGMLWETGLILNYINIYVWIYENGVKKLTT